MVIEKGRIIKTRGFSNNLISYITQSEFKNDSSEDFSKSISYYSYDQPKLDNLKVTTSITLQENQNITILGEKKILTLYEEELRNDYLGWKVINRFWLDNNNFVWKSEQTISPKLPKIVIEVTKKPS